MAAAPAMGRGGITLSDLAHEIGVEDEVRFDSPSAAPRAAATRAAAAAAPAMGRVVITLSDLAREIGVEDEVCSDSPSAAPRAAAAARAASAARMGAVGWASLDDERPRGNPDPRLLRLQRLGVSRPQDAPDWRLYAHSAAKKNSHGFNQADERVGHVVPCNCKYCSKQSPLLVGRKKKNHVQVDGNCKRVARPAVKNNDEEPAPPEGIFEALREIPMLERADLLRAYSALVRDDRLFRSLMALPKDMRKDWLLVEIGNQ